MSGFQSNRHILLTNDDGIVLKEGLMSLFNRISKASRVKLTAVIPANEQSAASHSITIQTPVFIDIVSKKLNKEIFSVRGTPTDCIKLALNYLMAKPPDYVISGINLGANVGTDVFYSGTVAAALEASLMGITSFAVSWERSISRQKESFIEVASLAWSIIISIIRKKPRQGSVFNINIPSRTKNIKGIRYTLQNLMVPRNAFVRRYNQKLWMDKNECILTMR